VPIAVLSYAELILIVRGALGAIGIFFSPFSNQILGSHSTPYDRLSGPLGNLDRIR